MLKRRSGRLLQQFGGCCVSLLKGLYSRFGNLEGFRTHIGGDVDSSGFRHQCLQFVLCYRELFLFRQSGHKSQLEVVDGAPGVHCTAAGGGPDGHRVVKHRHFQRLVAPSASCIVVGERLSGIQSGLYAFPFRAVGGDGSAHVLSGGEGRALAVGCQRDGSHGAGPSGSPQGVVSVGQGYSLRYAALPAVGSPVARLDIGIGHPAPVLSAGVDAYRP